MGAGGQPPLDQLAGNLLRLLVRGGCRLDFYEVGHGFNVSRLRGDCLPTARIVPTMSKTRSANADHSASIRESGLFATVRNSPTFGPPDRVCGRLEKPGKG